MSYHKKEFSFNLVTIVVVIAVVVAALSVIGHLSGGFENMKISEWNLRERNEENLISGEFKDYNEGNGVTAEGDKYGVITVDGMYMGDGESVSIAVDTVTLEAGTYTLSGDIKGSNFTYRLSAKDSGGLVVATSGLNNATFSLGSTTTLQIVIEVFKGVELENVKISPVLVKGTEPGDFFA